MGWSKIHDEVLKKINQESAACQDRRMTGSQVYARAEEITAMNFCYNQLLGNFHDSQEKDLAPLPQCEKPLEMLCSHWMSSQNVDLSGEFNRTLRNMDCQEEHDGPELGPSML